ncbi:hypothetical protein B0H12DRAFT_370776 [Mycena haematopus]|nr:hypothetical protein B0H12DRAFT_370776 [Mycena haematopus]
MLSVFRLAVLALSLLSASEPILGRELWLERNDRAIQLNPRRFGQNHPAVLMKLRAACGGAVCGKLAGAAVTPLLAKQAECTQQDMADQIIDASKQFNATTQQNMLAIAIEYRQTEKNTPPDFKTKPPRCATRCSARRRRRTRSSMGLCRRRIRRTTPLCFSIPQPRLA